VCVSIVSALRTLFLLGHFGLSKKASNNMAVEYDYYQYKMVKEKTKEHGLEYVILNDNDSELWEIDYDTGHAVNVSEYVQLGSFKHDSIVKYSGKIEDFLLEQRRCKNIHFHETMDVQPRLHMKSCSFETPN
jgi:hypothetical protein